MDELSRLAQDLDPSLSEAERSELVAVGMHLQAARPLPAPAFRGDLKRHLFSPGSHSAQSTRSTQHARARNRNSSSRSALRTGSPSRSTLAARTLRARIMASATSGLALLALAAISLTGAGPFAA